MGATNGLMAGSAVAQGAATAGNAYAQGSAARAKGEYQKQMYELNAELADYAAEDAVNRGDKNALSVTKKVRRVQGDQRAALSAQGIDPNSGSAAAVVSDTATLGAIDALTIRNNAWREAWGYKVEALNDQYSGKFAGIAADAAGRNTILTGGLSFLASGMKAYGKEK